ncbi:mucin-13b isoform X9 [Silurus meridionalis]|uniref:mucin-13b isoform X9 n=1 Tax=Silurus meridionalis TaxID=175797 RepID=UPI001EE9E452|nr:mucin-13b isoform X9 [Silurus meridionalis]
MAVIKSLLSLGLLLLLVAITNVTTVNPDATTTSVTTVNPEDATTTSVTTVNPDATTTSVTTVNPEDATTTSVTTVNPDATTTSVTTVNPEDATTTSVTTVNPDATTTSVTTVNPEDATTTSVTTVNPDATTTSVTTVNPDATTTSDSTVTPDATTTSDSTVTPDGSNQTAGSTPAPTTPRPGHCVSSPCSSGSTCVELLTNYTCMCQTGMVYDERLRTCILAKTFPTDLRFQMNYISEMKDKNSEIFKETAEDIVQKLKNAFSSTDGYIGSVVLKLTEGSVIADVDLFFSITSNVTEDKINKEIQSATNATVAAKNLCMREFCDTESTKCTSNDGQASCSCLKGYVKLTVTQQACTSCPSGQKAVESVRCENCPFGYSGFDCEESFLLILVVVACVLGTLLLCTFISTVVLYSRSRKTIKSSDRKQSLQDSVDFKKPVGIPRIPRANANSGWQPTNLEMTESGSRHALVSKDSAEKKDMWDYDYIDDSRSFRSQTPSRTNNGSRVTRNPYNDAYADQMRKY